MQARAPVLLFVGDAFDVEVLELLVGGWAGGAGHEILALLCFWEGYDVTDAGGAVDEGTHTVEAEREAAVWWGAVLEGFQHVAEAGLDDFGVDLEDVFEDALLEILLVDTDGSAADFHAVEHDVVGLGADFVRAFFEEVHVLGDGRGEGVVRCGVLASFLVLEHEGEVRYPEEFPVVLADFEESVALHELAAVEAYAAEDGAGLLPVTGGEEDSVTGLDVHGFGEVFELFLGEKFEERAFPLVRRWAVCADVGEAFRAVGFCCFFELLDLLGGDLCA